jgi:hypothetical protein
MIGFIGGVLLSKWNILKDTFFKIELFNIINFTSTIIASLIIAYFVTRKVHYSLKQKEIIYRVVDEFRLTIVELFDLGSFYIDNKISKNERKILQKFKTAGIQLDLVIKFAEELDLKSVNSSKDKFFSFFFSYKAALTDSPFGGPEEFSEDQKLNFVTKYEALRTFLNKIAFNMYE